MRILLVQSFSRTIRPVFPVGLARIISLIKEKNEVAVFDPNIEIRIKDSLAEKIREFDPDLIGISLRNIDFVDYVGRVYFYPDFVNMLKFIKMIKPSVKIVVGGSAFSLFANQIMVENDEIDVGVYLEGDESFPELLEEFDNPLRVRGVFIRNSHRIKFTGKRPAVDFVSLPKPSYEYFDLHKYISRGIGIGIEAKRGCRLKCSYCPYPFLTGENLRIRSAEDVVDEIEFVTSQYGIKQFSFVDSVFTIPSEHSESICEEIISRGLDISWSAWINEKTFTEEYARLALSAGCEGFFFSTDAFSDKSLRLLRKNYTNKDILLTVEKAQHVDNIKVGYGFFLNPPGSSIKTLAATIRFLVKAKLTLKKKMHGRRLFLFNRIRIEPHTRIREIAIKENIITPHRNLLRPVYYTHGSTRLLEFVYDVLTWPIGVLIKLRRLRRVGLRYFSSY